jgi:hypothetical protein
MLTIPVTQIVSRNCGGCGAWLDNPLSSPSPSSQIWPGFQLGGGMQKLSNSRKLKKKMKLKNMKKLKKTRKSKNMRKLKKTRKSKNMRKLKKTRKFKKL